MDDIEEWLSTDLVRPFIFSFFTWAIALVRITFNALLVLLVMGGSETSKSCSLFPFEGNI